MSEPQPGSGAFLNARVLIDAIVRQTTVLLAQLATSGGLRAPLAHVANQVFLDLSKELESQGVSRKVSADMFGMALRAYLRKVRRLEESSSERGRSLWEAVLEFVRESGLVSRRRVMERFGRDDEALVRGVLHDLTESGLVFAAGSTASCTYRAASAEELAHMAEDGADELIWALVRREGPIGRRALGEMASLGDAELDNVLDRLSSDGRIRCDEGGDEARFSADALVIPLGGGRGWEAAVFDHYHALVQTICRKLAEPQATAQDTVGGSTYTYEIWTGHPYEQAVTGLLGKLRQQHEELWDRVEEYNQRGDKPRRIRRVVAYGGQYVAEEEG